jgi:hypothetical protein
MYRCASHVDRAPATSSNRWRESEEGDDITGCSTGGNFDSDFDVDEACGCMVVDGRG